jgi:hypothetical protein
MPDGIQSTVRLFADDTIAYVTISSDADAANLQQNLDKLAEWESKWFMKFHPEKCNHTELAYSRVGLTRDTYAFYLIDLLEMFMFLLRKLMVLLALEQMVLICLPHLRSDEMVHPRYFAVRLFADDTIAYVTISSDADAANLQQDLDKLAEWK